MVLLCLVRLFGVLLDVSLFSINSNKIRRVIELTLKVQLVVIPVNDTAITFPESRLYILLV